MTTAYPAAARSRAVNATAQDKAESQEGKRARSRGRGRCATPSRYLMNTYRRPPLVFVRGEGLLSLRPARAEVSGFSRRHRRQCAGACASAAGAGDAARGRRDGARLQSVPQFLYQGPLAQQAGGLVGHGPRVFQQQRHRSRRGRAEAGACWLAHQARRDTERRASWRWRIRFTGGRSARFRSRIR